MLLQTCAYWRTLLQNEQAVSELKGEIHSLVDELNALSLRNDEIMAEREQDAATMNDMEAKVEEYRRKYDAVRIELRNLKGASITVPSLRKLILCSYIDFVCVEACYR